MSLEDEIYQKLKKIINSKKFLDPIGKSAVREYKAKTRMAENMAGDKFSYKNPTKRAKEKKKIISIPANKKHRAFRANSANLTITGQLVDSITYEIKEGPEIIITSSGDHMPYVNAKGEPMGDVIPNKTLFKHLQEKGFNVFVISDYIEEELNRKAKEELRRRFETK